MISLSGYSSLSKVSLSMSEEWGGVDESESGESKEGATAEWASSRGSSCGRRHDVTQRERARQTRRLLITGWKRLLLADGPRQSINALVLYSFAYSFGFQTHDIPAYWEHSAITAMLLFAQLATVLIFAGSLILLVAAALLYVPLLCYIQGNLKEYVCHKVDKVSLSSMRRW